VFTDGNKTQIYGTLTDLGWRGVAVNLAPYAGQTIELCLVNVTRLDVLFNTWTVVDDVKVVNLEHRLFVPTMQRGGAGSAKSAATGVTESPHNSDPRR
jgi:hypothetical protein